MALLYFHTIRHLKLIQISARVSRAMRMTTRSGAPIERALPLRAIQSPIAFFPSRLSTVLEDGSFRFLNKTGAVRQASDWNSATQSRLWLYNLHYFDDLMRHDASDCEHMHRTTMKRWMAENSPGEGVAWEPYPLSLRIVNWIKWHLSGHALDESAQMSLARQARALMQNVEWHLLGNHLLANAKALLAAGLFFEGQEARTWVEKATDIYRNEMPEQVLADGGHFERSPMYQAIILEDMLDMLNLARVYGRSDLATMFEGAVGKMRPWLKAMCHRDGEIAYFNDAVLGIAPRPIDLEEYAIRLGFERLPMTVNSLHLKNSGFIRMEGGKAVVLANIGSVTPAYIPGHAHADTLSMELSLIDQRVIVNCGISTYEATPQRRQERSTAAHSTVEVDAENSSEVWGAFRVARRAKVVKTDVELKHGKSNVSAQHDGYVRLPGKNIHTRNWLMDENSLTVTDSVTGPYYNAHARFHVAPQCRVEAERDGRSGRIITTAGNTVTWTSETPTEVTESEWHPGFGLTQKTAALRVQVLNGRSAVRFEWG
jgi:uncharacterized heparinase superfamily protein